MMNAVNMCVLGGEVSPQRRYLPIGQIRAAPLSLDFLPAGSLGCVKTLETP